MSKEGDNLMLFQRTQKARHKAKPRRTTPVMGWGDLQFKKPPKLKPLDGESKSSQSSGAIKQSRSGR